MTILDDFKKFILRGNVVDLAVGVVMGAAFGGVVTSMVKDIITPIVSIPGKVNFADLTFQVGGGVIKYGEFLNNIVSFLIVAVGVFFLVVRPVNWLMSHRKQEEPADPTEQDCPFCLKAVPIKASRCCYCTSQLDAPAAGAAGEAGTLPK